MKTRPTHMVRLKMLGITRPTSLAAMDPRTRAGLDAGYNFGHWAVGDAGSFMDTAAGFAGNYADLYNRASQDMLGNATSTPPPTRSTLIEAAMMDDRRRLNEAAASWHPRSA